MNAQNLLTFLRIFTLTSMGDICPQVFFICLFVFPGVEIRMAIQNGFKIYFLSLVFCSLNVINQGDVGFLLVCGSFRNFYWFVFPEFAGFVIKFGEFAGIITSNMSSLFFFLLLLNTNWLHL